MRRIGILGGTFNPPHFGHLLLAEQVRQILKLDRIIFIPSYHPPHKKARDLAGAKHRCRMISLAVRHNPYFKVSRIEIRRAGTSYSAQTVSELAGIYSGARLYFIVGSDFLKEFSGWKDLEKINKISRFIIAQRPGYNFEKASLRKTGLPRNMRFLQISAMDISSSQIRRFLRRKKSIRYLVPEAVRKYILRKKLYQQPSH